MTFVIKYIQVTSIKLNEKLKIYLIMKITKEDLLKKYQDKNFQENFVKLFTLSYYFGCAILNKTFVLTEEFEEYIVLTAEGESLFKKIKKKKNKNKENYSIKFSIFLTFYHEELFIDVLKTNYIAIEQKLNQYILSKDIKFPWIYGRLLYDKYFEEFEGEDTFLNNEQVSKLMNDTPSGVFQISNLIVGPFGALNSKINRFIPPTRNVKLWHCSDPSCSSFHSVLLENADIVIKEIESEIIKTLSNIKKSEWSNFYFDLIEPNNFYYDYNRTSEIHLILINAFGNNEIKDLLKFIIDSNKSIRDEFPDLKKLKGSSSEIVSKLDKAECFQLILLENDEKIISSLETLIENKTIDIPPTEIRTSMLNMGGGFYDVTHQCNRLGIRSVLDSSNQSLVRLIKVIESIHDEEGAKEDLQWKLMNYKKDSLKETIESYVLSEEPRTIIKESILYGPRQTIKAFELFYGNFKSPNNEEDKEYLIDKMLWKLGFEINIFPSTLDEFWKKLKLFKEIGSNSNVRESDKDDIRSAAVNFYVLLEEVLEHSLSFITWTLLSDHFIDTKFKYIFEEARNVMCEKLNGQIMGQDEVLKLDNTGGNNLFGLIEGFSVLINLCDELLLGDKSLHQRPENELPHFHNKTELTTFPFQSKLFLFDIKQNTYNELKSIINELPKEFNRYKVASVRNRLEHKNKVKNRVDNFPNSNEIIEACECIEKVISKLINLGIYPNVFLFKKYTNDEYNRNSFELEDYRGKNILLKPLQQFSGSRLPKYKKPQVISSIINIGESSEPLRFTYHETSEYLKFWQNFPRKKNNKSAEKTSKKVQ